MQMIPTIFTLFLAWPRIRKKTIRLFFDKPVNGSSIKFTAISLQNVFISVIDTTYDLLTLTGGWVRITAINPLSTVVAIKMSQFDADAISAIFVIIPVIDYW